MGSEAKHALVTGASSGIGREIARVLAQKGWDCTLVARRMDRLRELASEIEDSYGTAVRLLACDLVDASDRTDLIERLTTEVHPVNFLVNNAGIGHREAFRDAEWVTQSSMMALNMDALVHLTHTLVPSMIERGWGRILNISSTAGFVPGPGMAVYYASKAFVTSFGEALDEELRETAVRVTTVCPGATQTEFGERSGMTKTKLFVRSKVEDARQVAEQSVEAALSGKRLLITSRRQQLIVLSTRVAPRKELARVARKMMEETN